MPWSPRALRVSERTTEKRTNDVMSRMITTVRLGAGSPELILMPTAGMEPPGVDGEVAGDAGLTIPVTGGTGLAAGAGAACASVTTVPPAPAAWAAWAVEANPI